MGEPEVEPFDENDNFERGTVTLTPAEREAREREKKQLLDGHVVVESAPPTRARRIRPGQERDYPDQVAAHQPAPPTREELDAERAPLRLAGPVVVSGDTYARGKTRVPGENKTIEVLAAQVREDEERLKESKALLRRALKKLGVR